MDALDRGILAALLRDGRISWQALGAAVGLGPTATADRVRRLREDGALRGFTALLDPAAIGRPLELVADVVLAAADRAAAFEAAVAGIPAVTGAVHLTGPSDYLVQLRCRDPADVDATLAALKAAGAARTETRLVLRHVAGIDPATALGARPPR